MAGYSGKPLVTKLGVAEGQRVALVDAPAGFPAALAPLPSEVRLLAAASEQVDVDVAIIFSRAASHLEERFAAAVAALRPGGMIWVAWPKKASRQPTDLTEDVVRGIGLAAGLVDVKVCAIDETWSGLKFLRRRVPGAKGAPRTTRGR
ncbi:MAG TPA: DUF3052 family protein [Gemmatimonadaceae bacterium]|nr:DUF3052 family protein [Gemmatimonadaceae bacterium]